MESFAGHLQYLVGQSQMQLERLDEAEEAFQQAIVLKKDDAEIHVHSHFYLGQIYERREQTDEAIAAYQNVLSVANHPELKEIQTEAARQLAHIYENSTGQSLQNQAIELYAQISTAEVSPKLTAEALYRRGLIYQGRNEPDKAAEELSHLVDRFSKETEPEIKEIVEDAILRLPNLSSQIGDMSTAIKTAKQALQIARKKGDVLVLAQAQFQLATLYYQNGTHRKEAVKLFKVAYNNALKAESMDSTTVALVNTAMFQAGQAAYQNNDQAAAIQPLKNFIRQFPDDEKIDVVYEYLAWSYFTVADKTKAGAGRKARFKKAAEAFNQLVTRNVNPEKSPEWMYQSAQALTLAGETAQAIAAYQQLMEVHPKHNLADEALYTMGGMQFESKQYDEALKTYQQLANGYPDSDWTDEALYAIATCYDQLKQDEKALETYKAVIERFPDQIISVNAQANIGHHYFNLKEYPQALEAYRKLTKKNFPSMTAKLRSNAYRWRRDTENVMAEAPYKEAVSLLNKADTGSENLSDEEKGYAQRAIQQFEGLIKDYPYCAYVDYALASIGSAHELREEWESALKAYRQLIARYKRKSPKDANIQQMLDYAQERIKAIEVFLLQKEKFGQ
ncbi:MAG: tetratricopeptide repeat protein, partial [Candidatus Poribacteria bacterium]